MSFKEYYTSIQEDFGTVVSLCDILKSVTEYAERVFGLIGHCMKAGTIKPAYMPVMPGLF